LVTEIRDFSEYKYKFFTGLTEFEFNKEDGVDFFKNALSNPKVYAAVCVKECPTEAKVDSDELLDCMINNEVQVCPGYKSELANIFYDTKEYFNYCIPRADEAVELVTELYKELDENIGGFGNYINDIKDAWFVMLVMSVVSLCVTVFYVWLLQHFTKPLLYTSLVLIFVLGCATGYFAYSQTQTLPKESKEYAAASVGSYVIWIIVALYTCFIVCNWDNISLGASIMETASEFVTENKSIVTQPLKAYAICLPIICWWTLSAVFIYSMGTPIFEEQKFVATIEGGTGSTFMFCYFAFGLFWILSWVIAMQNFSTIATTCMWYFTGEGSDAVEYRRTYSSNMALSWAFKYHAGSMAMGSFLIAIVTISRLVFEYLIYQYEKAAPKDNVVWKVIKAVIRFVSWLMDACVKFVNKNAYIQIALQNQSFCPAAKTSFYLAIRNVARASAVGIISGIIAVLGKGFIVAACAFLTISIIDSTQPEIKEPYICAMLISFWAYMVASIFLSLFEDSAITILYCFILDEEHGGSTRTPDSLRPFLELAD
jgi:hypothetical protein